MRPNKLDKKYFGKTEDSPRFRTPYSLPHERTSDIGVFSPSMTKQAEMEGCDINHIMKRYETTGVLPDLIKGDPQYGNFADIGTYQDSLELVRFAQEQFASLSAPIRKEFDNDPAKFLEFTHNPANAERMAELGLMSEAAVKRVLDARAARKEEPPTKSEGKPPRHKKDEPEGE